MAKGIAWHLIQPVRCLSDAARAKAEKPSAPKQHRRAIRTFNMRKHASKYHESLGRTPATEHTTAIRSRSRKVVLVDVYDEGHHRSFVNLYARVLAESGLEVVAVCPFPLEDIPLHLQPRVTHILLSHDLIADNGHSILRSINVLCYIARIIRQIDRIQLILFMDKPSYMKILPGRVIDLFFSFPWAVLDIHPSLEEGDNGLLRRVKVKLFGRKSISEKYFSSGYLKFVAFLSETAPETYKRYYPHHVFAWLPDASPERTLSKEGRIAAAIRRASHGRKIVTIAGALERRKGLYQMMYLALNADTSRFFFAFCGKPYWDTFEDYGRLFKEFYASSPENCYFHLEFISDLGDENEFDSILHCSDIIFSAMQGYEHSSNVVTKAARMRKPVIVTGKGVCGLRAMKYRLGAVIPENDVFCALQALERLAEANHKAAWDEYARDFSVLRLRQALFELCEQPTCAGEEKHL
jgi:hypothetical protein